MAKFFLPPQTEQFLSFEVRSPYPYLMNYTRLVAKTLLRFSAVFLAVLMPVSASGASDVPGGKCPKVGAYIIHLPNDLTCVKSGKKLIWQKVTPPKSPAKTKVKALPSPSQTEDLTGHPGTPCLTEGQHWLLQSTLMTCRNGTWQVDS